MIEELFLSHIEHLYFQSIKKIIIPFSKQRQDAVLYPALKIIKSWSYNYKLRKSDTSDLYQDFKDFGKYCEDYYFRELWSIIVVYDIISKDYSVWNSILSPNEYESYISYSLRYLLANKMNIALSSPEGYPPSLIKMISFHTADLERRGI